LLDRVLRVLKEEMLAPERLAALREEIRRQDKAARAPEILDPLKERLATLETNIWKGYESLSIIDPEMKPGVQRVIAAWQRERDRLKDELAHKEGGGNLESLDETIRACEALLWQLEDAATSADPLLLREVIREAIARIELTWERRPYGKRTRYVLQGGVIHLRPQEGEKCLALPGKPCSTTSGPSPAST
jgi:hypothetical protein